jgi:alanyl-tRNA synthetase
MPVSEGARYRRFPDAGRPVQVDESYHPREATFGGSPVRLMMVSHGAGSVYETDVFFPWLSALHDLWQPETRSLRIITDHLRSAIVVIGDGTGPSSTGRGYVLRRLLRRTLTELWRGDGSRTLADLPEVLVQDTLTRFGQSVPPGLVQDVLLAEERKFGGLLSRGRSLLQRLYPDGQLTEDDYTYLHATHGLPRELVTELASEM